MLVPAILYKDELARAFHTYDYSDDMMYYTGWLGNYEANFSESENDCYYKYAIVDNDKLIGYFGYYVNWYNSCVSGIGLFSFDRGNPVVGLNVMDELHKLINDYHIHRIEWRMTGGNPVEKHYDKFCEKFHGKKFVFTDCFKDRTGKYHDDVMYEIVFDRSDNNANNT